MKEKKAHFELVRSFKEKTMEFQKIKELVEEKFDGMEVKVKPNRRIKNRERIHVIVIKNEKETCWKSILDFLVDEVWPERKRDFMLRTLPGENI